MVAFQNKFYKMLYLEPYKNNQIYYLEELNFKYYQISLLKSDSCFFIISGASYNSVLIVNSVICVNINFDIPKSDSLTSLFFTKIFLK